MECFTIPGHTEDEGKSLKDKLKKLGYEEAAISLDHILGKSGEEPIKGVWRLEIHHKEDIWVEWSTEESYDNFAMQWNGRDWT